jgi:hypothetical protein
MKALIDDLEQSVGPNGPIKIAVVGSARTGELHGAGPACTQVSPSLAKLIEQAQASRLGAQAFVGTARPYVDSWALVVGSGLEGCEPSAGTCAAKSAARLKMVFGRSAVESRISSASAP